ncbi:hypothetical protein [Paraburkholderia sp. SIMBA_030]|uniref:hypothetical protein n=1 Tax=Paraburkholderia sp. SIMBA_030 TaxID=3085773 RepID=UPI003979BED1
MSITFGAGDDIERLRSIMVMRRVRPGGSEQTPGPQWIAEVVAFGSIRLRGKSRLGQPLFQQAAEVSPKLRSFKNDETA